MQVQVLSRAPRSKRELKKEAAGRNRRCESACDREIFRNFRARDRRFAGGKARAGREIFRRCANVIIFWEHDGLSPSRTQDRHLALGSCRSATATPPIASFPSSPPHQNAALSASESEKWSSADADMPERATILYLGGGD